MVNTVSKLTVFNLALQQLGVTKTLTDTSNNTKEGSELNKAFSLVLFTALESNNWDFATKHAELSLISNADNLTEYQFLFAPPSDSIRLWSVYAKSPTNPIDYKSTSEGIYTDSETTYVEYTFLNEDFSTYPADFKEHLIFKLAEFTGPGILSTDSRSDELRKKSQMSQSKAASQSIVQHPKSYEFDSDWLAGRNVY